ncbi:1-deoxy-D-xylulose-5-phosphate reductoisomerase [Halieaceae bacterium IMCC14734]|uniref:1-deoxy-D-xylulose 5-phosphate reductoisomerase n=1 Tax=Candidatus Litorirhabdus singularis TaxID=2518993 RepID=A0ABT3TIK7_9GAMM|nr:1-deoxy-D-xylulose-5-phosphate reductoisomerase [Candidatus Litorirhabdus singularis]MCX2982147.1 1-deoxy-D-xylulose-5-phosphate reductoisomerase [Candidatus Litorirhabdus singularis]
MQALRLVTVLGSTGSIGVSTLDVIARHPEQFEVYALTARQSVAVMLEQCQQFRPRYAVMLEPEAAAQLRQQLLAQGLPTQVLSGASNLVEVAADAKVDIVMAAIVGAAGLAPTLAAAQQGKQVLLANKEALVMAGGLFMSAVRDANAVLLPIDSEHNAIFQCLPSNAQAQIDKRGFRKILLTASGGPFRDWSAEAMREVTPDQACAHPNWDMGRKISVDSATLMNKGLELIEACWLFDVSAADIEIVVHPQSIVHSMVQYNDGSVLAQLGNPDMRTPIAYGLGWPERIDSGVADLDIVAAGQLDFEAPDEQRFPCLRLAREAVERGGICMAALNAANEVAVEAFLEERISFTAIAEVIEQVLQQTVNAEPVTLNVVQQADSTARLMARDVISGMS